MKTKADITGCAHLRTTVLILSTRNGWIFESEAKFPSAIALADALREIRKGDIALIIRGLLPARKRIIAALAHKK